MATEANIADVERYASTSPMSIMRRPNSA